MWSRTHCDRGAGHSRGTSGALTGHRAWSPGTGGRRTTTTPSPSPRAARGSPTWPSWKSCATPTRAPSAGSSTADNIELPEPDCSLHLVELVRKGVLQERQLDEL